MANSNNQAPVIADVTEGIMTITLNRPERGNAWNPAVAAAYFGFLEEAAKTPAVRAIVVTGAGKTFCSGGDAGELDNVAESGDVRSKAQHPYWFPLQVGKPIIGAINGACVGVGMQQALYTDIRILSENARFSTFFAKLGLVAEMGLSWMLPRLIGATRAADLMFSARMVGAEEACAMGLGSKVVPADRLLDETREYAARMVSKNSPWSMRMMKSQLYADMMCDVTAAYERAVSLADKSVLRDDFKEGLKSLSEKREPNFEPLSEELAIIDLPELL